MGHMAIAIYTIKIIIIIIIKLINKRWMGLHLHPTYIC